MTITYLAGLHGQPTMLTRRGTRSTSLSFLVDQDGAHLVVASMGEVDAGNAKFFADQVCAAIADAGAAVRALTVDLSGLDFFAVDGCAALHAINALAMRVELVWSVLPSAAVSRVLQLCDPAAVIPVVDPEALAEPA